MKHNQQNPTIQNPDSTSYLRHKRQRFWQILFPLLMGILLFLGAATLMVLTVAGVSTGINTSQYAATSVIWIIIPLMLVALLLLGLLGGLVYLLARLLKILPGYTARVQQIFAMISSRVADITNKAADPVVSVKSFGSAVSVIVKKMAGLFK
jgi:hypothetical protein